MKTAVGSGLVAAAALAWLWLLAPWVSPWPVIGAAAALLAACVAWAALVPGRSLDALWALAAALVITAESAWEYGELPENAVAFQIAALVPALAAAGWQGFSGGWRSGFRVGLGTALLSNAGLALVFAAWLGQPLQATVLESGGALARFQASSNPDFLSWSVADFWSSTGLRLLVGAVSGAGLGALARWGRSFGSSAKRTDR